MLNKQTNSTGNTEFNLVQLPNRTKFLKSTLIITKLFLRPNTEDEPLSLTLEKEEALSKDIFCSDNISIKVLPEMEGRSTTSGAETPEIQFQPLNSPTQIFILSGQSNMAGRGGVIKDHHHNRWVWDKIVPPECAPNSSILRLSADLRWEEAREPLHADIDTGKVCGVGPGMAFANAVRKRFDSDSAVIGLVPCASGGTAIKEWARGSHLYETMVKRAEDSRKCGGEIKAVLWYQGESDVLDIHDAESYGSNMDRLIKNIRHDLNIHSLPIIQVAIASGGGYIDKVREAQLGLKLSNVVCVDAKGLPLKPDNLHLTTEAQVQLGLSLAEAYLSNFC